MFFVDWDGAFDKIRYDRMMHCMIGLNHMGRASTWKPEIRLA